MAESPVFDYSDSPFEELHLLRHLYDKKFRKDALQEIKRQGTIKDHKELNAMLGELDSHPYFASALDTFVNPKLVVDFQYDQVSPITKQTLDIRAILRKRGLDA